MEGKEKARMSAQDLEQRARELLAAEYERERCPNSAAAVRNNDAIEVDTDIAIRVIVAALRQQPAPVVSDASMARALEAARCGLPPEHVSAIEEAIAAYDPSCGARTVRVGDAMRELIEAAKKAQAMMAMPDRIEPRHRQELCDAISRCIVVPDPRIARAQGVQS